MELFPALISHASKQVSSTLNKHVFNFNTSPSSAKHFHLLNITEMTTLLQIASKVEAAMKAYISVWDFADKEEWKGRFRGEMVSPHLHSVLDHSTIQIEKCN